ncbi:LAFA_0F12398g1_1 [Lachancea sp. 'fantastica']|nr:LAFA_0F12398g1_1 [Lachancea sp. 'fantastica']
MATKLVPISSPGLHLGDSDGLREKEARLSGTEVSSSEEPHITHKTLPLQAYMHYAEIQRDYERVNDTEGLFAAQAEQIEADPHSNMSSVKLDAQRALRIAKASSVFFLITTDILGPTNAPYAVAQMGWAPGIILYVLFGIFAALGGWLLTRSFCKVDSNNYPIRTFSDLAGRAVAPWFKFPLAILQFIQLILNCGVLLLGVAQAVSQMQIVTKGHDGLCFTVDILVWALLCMAVGQIRSFRKFTPIANSAVWMNIAICIITMVGVAVGGPYYGIFTQYGKGAPYFEPDSFIPLPVKHHAIAPGTISDKISGMNNMVFAWGGATLFCEVMAEMKKPMDFWKGMICAQGLIMVVYLFYGLFVYGYNGQFSYVTANQGIGSIGLQNAANVLNIITQLIAAVLYGNVGVKVFYQGFMVPYFRFPELMTRKGTVVWGFFVTGYWAIAYILGTAIPSVSALVSIIGAFCIFNFSYTFPFFFAFCLLWRQDAGLNDTFDLTTLTVEQGDSYLSGFSRWKRAIAHGGMRRFTIKLALMLVCLASLATCGLCSYSAIEGAIDAYKTNPAQPFTCTSPVT